MSEPQESEQHVLPEGLEKIIDAAIRYAEKIEKEGLDINDYLGVDFIGPKESEAQDVLDAAGGLCMIGIERRNSPKDYLGFGRYLRAVYDLLGRQIQRKEKNQERDRKEVSDQTSKPENHPETEKKEEIYQDEGEDLTEEEEGEVSTVIIYDYIQGDLDPQTQRENYRLSAVRALEEGLKTALYATESYEGDKEVLIGLKENLGYFRLEQAKNSRIEWADEIDMWQETVRLWKDVTNHKGEPGNYRYLGRAQEGLAKAIFSSRPKKELLKSALRSYGLAYEATNDPEILGELKEVQKQLSAIKE